MMKEGYCRGRTLETGSLGAHWMNYGKCLDCGKRVKMLKGGNRLYQHKPATKAK